MIQQKRSKTTSDGFWAPVSQIFSLLFLLHTAASSVLICILFTKWYTHFTITLCIQATFSPYYVTVTILSACRISLSLTQYMYKFSTHSPLYFFNYKFFWANLTLSSFQILNSLSVMSTFIYSYNQTGLLCFTSRIPTHIVFLQFSPYASNASNTTDMQICVAKVTMA